MSATNTIEGKGAFWYWILVSVMAFVIICGNSLVIFLIVTRARLHVTPNWFVLSLSIADLSVGLIVAPSYIAYTFWIDANFGVLVMFYNLLFYASVGNLCVMTFDRYVAITRPLRYPSVMTTSMALRLIALAWVLPMMITLMPLCWKDLKWSSPAAQDASNSTFDGAERANQIYLGIVLVLFEILPCIVILLTFTRLYFVVRNQSRRIKALEIAIRFNLDIRTQRKRKIERSTVNAFFAVIIMFEICWVLSAYRAFCSYYNVCTISLLFVQTSRLFLFFNSVVNFFVFALLKSDIRDEIKQLIRFWSKVSVGTVTIQKEKQRTLLPKKPSVFIMRQRAKKKLSSLLHEMF